MRMKPSEKCKRAGLDGLTDLARATGESERSLINWSRSRPRRFELLILGILMERARAVHR